jgi:hypothetical protein
VPGELRVALEAVDRADLGEQLRGGQGAAAGQLEQRRRGLRGPLLELDRVSERQRATSSRATRTCTSGC